MGGEARLVLYEADETRAIAAARAAFDEIESLETCASDWRADSELSLLTGRATSGPVALSPRLFDLLSRAFDVAERTDGAFDPTVGPLVELWRAARRSGRLPEPDALAAARARVGRHLARLDASTRTIDLARADVRLDLGGIGKGHACARALDVLAAHGVARALVQLGGDVACSAAPPGARGWAIDTAPTAQESRGERLVLSNAAVSTSGDREQHVVIDGVTYSHVVDPGTGVGLVTRARIVVVAPDASTSDALATALGVAWSRAGRDASDAERGAAVAALLERFPGVEAAVFGPPPAAGPPRFATLGWGRLPREFRSAQ